MKVSLGARVEHIADAPEALKALRRELGFDYGKFDYVEHGGRPILLDANRTPVYRGDPDAPHIVRLARGIRGFL